MVSATRIAEPVPEEPGADAGASRVQGPAQLAPAGSRDAPGPLDISCIATMGRVQDGELWTCVKLPDSATVFGTRGLVTVSGTVDGVPSRVAFMALVGGTRHKLPIASVIRRAIGKTDGDDVTILLEQRLS